MTRPGEIEATTIDYNVDLLLREILALIAVDLSCLFDDEPTMANESDWSYPEVLLRI